MITVKISFLSLLKDRFGAKELNMDLEDESTIKDLFSKLFEKYGEDIKKLLINRRSKWSSRYYGKRKKYPIPGQIRYQNSQ